MALGPSRRLLASTPMLPLRTTCLALAALVSMGGCDLIDDVAEVEEAPVDPECRTARGSTATVVVGEGGTLLVRDGETWRSERGPWGERDMLAVTFQSESVGFAVGELGTVALTQDGGANWFLAPLSGELVSVASPDGCTSVVASDQSRAYRTHDDGDTWERTRIDGTRYSWRGGQVEFSDDGWGVAVGAQRAGWIYFPVYPPGVLASDDHGETWDLATEPGGFDGLRAVSLAGPSALAVGYGGFVVLSVDRGETWGAPRASGLEHSLFGVHLFAGGRRAVAVGEGGAIYRSQDVGRNWEPVESPTAETLWDVAFVDDSYGVAVGDRGMLLVTADGGATWRREEAGTDADLYSVFLGSRL